MAQRARVELVDGRPDFGWHSDASTASLKALVGDLEAAAVASKVATARVEQLVNDARAAGVSWSVIGACLGMSRQAAHRQYASRALV